MANRIKTVHDDSSGGNSGGNSGDTSAKTDLLKKDKKKSKKDKKDKKKKDKKDKKNKKRSISSSTDSSGNGNDSNPKKRKTQSLETVGLNLNEVEKDSNELKVHNNENDSGNNHSSDQVIDKNREEQDGNNGASEEKLSKKEKKRLKKEKKKQKRGDNKNTDVDDNSMNHGKEKKKRKKNTTAEGQEQVHASLESTEFHEIEKSQKHNYDPKPQDITAAPNKDDLEIVGGRIVSYSASIVNEIDVEKKKKNERKASYDELEMKEEEEEEEEEKAGGGRICEGTTKAGDGNGSNSSDGCTLLLFYQYIEPVLDEAEFQSLFNHIETTGEQYSICGRARVSTEGLNCTLTGSYDNIRQWCKSLRSYAGGAGAGTKTNYFVNTEFKLTDDLPLGQAFKNFHAFRVDEIVNYGLAGERAPAVSMSGVHLEPKDYHKKMAEDNTVIIDVRNHYEAAIGKFNPPSNGATYIDPMMRKSTEFPVWLDKPETKEMLKGKQVLMYCTGGIRCERASALLRTKIENEEDTKQLGIKGVYQLQGGIDKYFREFPEGGLWKGKNYVFDKRFAHAPPVVENLERQQKSQEVLGQCNACHKPWDRYRGKKRCPTCGVPLIICKDCYNADKQKIKKIDKNVRCDLCVEEGVTSKRELREKEKKEMTQYEKKLREKYGFKEVHPKKSPSTAFNSGKTNNPTKKIKIVPNPNKITRLFIKNLNIREVDQPQLCELVEGITHIEWILDRNTKQWYGAVFVEVSTPENAAKAVGSIHKQKIYGRVVHCSFNKPDTKSIWPPPNTKI